MSAPTTVQPGFELLVSKVSLGLSYLSEARMLDNPDRKWNSVQNASKAFDTVQSLRTQHELTSYQAKELDSMMHSLQQGLTDIASFRAC